MRARRFSSSTNSARRRRRVIGVCRSCEIAARMRVRSVTCSPMRRCIWLKAAAAWATSVGPAVSIGARPGSSPSARAAAAMRDSGRVAIRTAIQVSSPTPSTSAARAAKKGPGWRGARPGTGGMPGRRTCSGVPSASGSTISRTGWGRSPRGWMYSVAGRCGMVSRSAVCRGWSGASGRRCSRGGRRLRRSRRRPISSIQRSRSGGDMLSSSSAAAAISCATPSNSALRPMRSRSATNSARATASTSAMPSSQISIRRANRLRGISTRARGSLMRRRSLPRRPR